MAQYKQLLKAYSVLFVHIAISVETFMFGMGWYKIIMKSRGKSSIAKGLELLKIRSPPHTKAPSKPSLLYFSIEPSGFLQSYSNGHFVIPGTVEVHKFITNRW